MSFAYSVSSSKFCGRLRSPTSTGRGSLLPGEALLLGIALSLDAFGAGIGAALVGFPAVPTAILIAAASGMFLWAGMRIGFLASGLRWVQRLTVLPGIILIAMGIFKLMQAS
ncbi:manganese efflux pump [Cohnella ginsengisoli]|uniref:manganese efflux pump n=1 Tax=Cohnella ginsengisoli TaxID=425004 RepID=UPI0030B87C34